MKVAITGGAGFIGYHLASAHAARGDTVILLDSLFKSGRRPDPDLARLLAEPKVRLIRHDLTRPLRGHADALARLDVVYHLAAINGTSFFYEIPYEVARTNLAVTLTLLDRLAARPPGLLVYSSTSEVYAGAESLGALPIPTDERVPVVFAQPTHPRFSYGTSKFMGEVLCREFGRQTGVPCVVVRYHNIYGPRMGTRHVVPELLAKIDRGQDPLELHGARETRAFCYVDDAVQATLRVAETPASRGQIVHIGNPHEEILVADLARLLLELAGRRAALRELGSRAGSVSRRCPDIGKLRALTGFEPQIRLREGLTRTIGWYREHARPVMPTPRVSKRAPARRRRLAHAG